MRTIGGRSTIRRPLPDVRRRRPKVQAGGRVRQPYLRVIVDGAPQVAQEPLLEVPVVGVAAPELERQRSPRDSDRLPQAEEAPGQPDIDVDLERRPEGAQDPQVERDRRFGRLSIEAVRENDVRPPRCLALPRPRIPPELPLLGDLKAVASVSPLALVVEDALVSAGVLNSPPCSRLKIPPFSTGGKRWASRML